MSVQDERVLIIITTPLISRIRLFLHFSNALLCSVLRYFVFMLKSSEI